MKIIIAGAGAVGFHLAELMSKENQDITLIDLNEEVLTNASTRLDVLTIRGDAGSVEIMEQAQVSNAELFIAVTTSEKTNLLVAILAKQAGAKKTIARITNAEYFEPEQEERFRNLGVDVLVSPIQLASQEILRLLHRASFSDLFEFEDGKISVVGFTLDFTCPLINRSIQDIAVSEHDFMFKAVALLRRSETIIPRGDTVLRKGDQLYLAIQNHQMDKAMVFVGKQLKPVKNVMIVGEGDLAINAAKLIEEKYNLTIVLNDKKQENKCVELLNKGLVIHATPGNINALKEEGLDQMDAFVALTNNSETNIITSLMAKETGVYKTIALVDDVNYTHISQNIGVGIDSIVNKKLMAANVIFRFIRKGKVAAIANLHGVDAEMIEFVIHKKNRILKHPIRKLHLPEHSIIAGVIRGTESFIPGGDFYFELNDKVIVLALPDAIHQVEEIFK